MEKKNTIITYQNRYTNCIARTSTIMIFSFVPTLYNLIIATLQGQYKIIKNYNKISIIMKDIASSFTMRNIVWDLLQWMFIFVSPICPMSWNFLSCSAPQCRVKKSGEKSKTILVKFYVLLEKLRMLKLSILA